MSIHCLELGWIGKYAFLGPRDLSQQGFCTPRPSRLPSGNLSGLGVQNPCFGKSLDPRGAFFPIHPSSRQCIITISIKHEDPTWKKILHLDQKPISWYSLVRFGEQVRQAQPVPPFNANVHLKCWKKNYWENKKLQWTYFRSRRISWKITNYIKYYYYLVRSKFSLNSCCCPRKRNLTFYI